jgi:crotonobetainyl-CoA:carnitine CoA-transferase CaiB-like acyl-CoA transferase
VFNDDEWQKLARCMGREDLIADPRFATISARKANEDALDKEVEKWTSPRDAYEIFHLLQKNGVQAGVVQTMEDLFEHDPQLKHRRFWAPTDHPEVGRVHAEGPPFEFSKTPFEVKKPAPMIGEHNELVFKEFLGVPPEEYDRLVKEGVIA